MKDTAFKNIFIAVALVLAIIYIAKFAGASMLKLYVQAGIGDCRQLPIFCIVPEQKIINPAIDKAYLAELTQYNLSNNIEIYVPKEIKMVEGTTTKVYYKKRPWRASGASVYLLREDSNFFVNLFPQMKKRGIRDDWEFLDRTMNARFDGINNLTDVFFVIMKSIFTPDLGDQRTVKIIEFSFPGKKGFISYNSNPLENYFDCNMIDSEGNFFKVYIKDKDACLDLRKVFTILLTLKKVPG